MGPKEGIWNQDTSPRPHVFSVFCASRGRLHVLNGMGYSECTIYAKDAVHLPPNNIASAYVQMMRANPS